MPAPCYCTEYSRKSETILLNCLGQNLTDLETSLILDAFLLTTHPNISPVGLLDFEFNNLTRVPSQIKSFTQLQTVYLNGNALTSIDLTTFNFKNISNPLHRLDLYTNSLKTIAPGTFRGQYQHISFIYKIIHC